MYRIVLRIVLKRAMIWMLVVTTSTMGIWPPDVMSMLVPALPTELASSADPAQPARIADIQKIQNLLESKVVRQRLEDFGISPEEINTKLAGLPDDQLHQFATEVDAIIPGGDGLGIVIALLVIAILAVILVYLLNHRIVITKNGS
jgi:hypothetical protein